MHACLRSLLLLWPKWPLDVGEDDHQPPVFDVDILNPSLVTWFHASSRSLLRVGVELGDLRGDRVELFARRWTSLALIAERALESQILFRRFFRLHPTPGFGDR